MKGNKSIYKFEDTDRTIVCFGRGRICVSNTQYENGDQLIWLGDTQKDRVIGLDANEVDGNWTWDGDVTGETVLLGFDNIRSIELLEHALAEAKQNLIKRDSTKVNKGRKS